MTFVDDTHYNAEVKAFASVDYLFLWLQTISPANKRREHIDALKALCEDLGWKLNTDSQGLIELIKQSEAL